MDNTTWNFFLLFKTTNGFTSWPIQTAQPMAYGVWSKVVCMNDWKSNDSLVFLFYKCAYCLPLFKIKVRFVLILVLSMTQVSWQLTAQIILVRMGK